MTPEELKELFNPDKLINWDKVDEIVDDIMNGDPEAVAFYERISGKEE